MMLGTFNFLMFRNYLYKLHDTCSNTIHLVLQIQIINNIIEI